MDKYYVLYDVDSYENFCIEVEEFNTKEEAEEFINERMNHDDIPLLDGYTVIKGSKVNLRVVKTITKCKIG